MVRERLYGCFAGVVSLTLVCLMLLVGWASWHQNCVAETPIARVYRQQANQTYQIQQPGELLPIADHTDPTLASPASHVMTAQEALQQHALATYYELARNLHTLSYAHPQLLIAYDFGPERWVMKVRINTSDDAGMMAYRAQHVDDALKCTKAPPFKVIVEVAE